MSAMPLLVPDKVNMNYANMIEEKALKVSQAMGVGEAVGVCCDSS